MSATRQFGVLFIRTCGPKTTARLFSGWLKYERRWEAVCRFRRAASCFNLAFSCLRCFFSSLFLFRNLDCDFFKDREDTMDFEDREDEDELDDREVDDDEPESVSI